MSHMARLAALFAAGALVQAQSFEVASVKPIAPDSPSREPQIDRQTFVLTGTLYDFVTDAYGLRPCGRRGAAGTNCALISGEPAWAKTDKFEIQAKLPDNSPAVARNQFSDGEAPQLDRMLQALLEDRFKLKVRRDILELPVYLLTAAKNGPKLKSSDGPILRQNADGSSFKIQGFYQLGSRDKDAAMWTMGFKNISMPGLAGFLTSIMDHPVLDRTGIKGQFDLTIDYDREPDAPNPSLWGRMMIDAPAIRAAFQEQLGLKIESAVAPVEVLIIDHVEQPSVN
jgi:uncharacterized protein (TIGR03435 family)